MLVLKLPRHATVLAHSLNNAGHYSDVDREKLLRLLLNRDDFENPKQLSHWLGQHMGVGSMVVFPSGERSIVAELAREAIEKPDNFVLLRDVTNRREFLRQFVFGMKEQAKHMCLNIGLAVDYGNWVLKAWRVLRSHRQRRGESEGIVLLGLHWLEKKDRQSIDLAKLRVWWQNLQAFLTAVVTDGGRPDCFTLFFGLYTGGYNDLTTPEELMRLGEIFTERILNAAQKGAVKLDELDQENHEFNSWRDNADYLAETIDSLRRDGSLKTDLQREQAHHLLSQLASEPIQSSKALEVLHRLQND